MNKYRIGDLISVRVRVFRVTEDENHKFTYGVKALHNNGDYMSIVEEDVTLSTMNIPTSNEVGKEAE